MLGWGENTQKKGRSGHEGVLIKHRGRKIKGKKGGWARSERSEIQSQIAMQKVEDGQVNVLSKNDNKCRRRGLGPVGYQFHLGPCSVVEKGNRICSRK